MKEVIWNFVYFITGFAAGAFAISLVLAGAGTFTEHYYILKLK